MIDMKAGTVVMELKQNNLLLMEFNDTKYIAYIVSNARKWMNLCQVHQA